jgi:hypothetical protein
VKTGAIGKDEPELVWANLDLELEMDRYGIYQVLDHLSDSDIIVRDQNGERELLGTEAVKFLERRGYVTYKNQVGFIATDRLKQFLREEEERADAAAAARTGSSAGADSGLSPGAEEASAQDGSSDTLLGVSGDEFEKIKRIMDHCEEEDRPDFDRCMRQCDGLEDIPARGPCREWCREQSDQRREACYQRLQSASGGD